MQHLSAITLPAIFIGRLNMLKGKNILLGVTGGIAAYKAANLASLLVKQHANVTVIMTENAREFITPTTFVPLQATVQLLIHLTEIMNFLQNIYLFPTARTWLLLHLRQPMSIAS